MIEAIMVCCCFAAYDRKKNQFESHVSPLVTVKCICLFSVGAVEGLKNCTVTFPYHTWRVLKLGLWEVVGVLVAILLVFAYLF